VTSRGDSGCARLAARKASTEGARRIGICREAQNARAADDADAEDRIGGASRRATRPEVDKPMLAHVGADETHRARTVRTVRKRCRSPSATFLYSIAIYGDRLFVTDKFLTVSTGDFRVR
jgi:hypothetical protein